MNSSNSIAALKRILWNILCKELYFSLIETFEPQFYWWFEIAHLWKFWSSIWDIIPMCLAGKIAIVKTQKQQNNKTTLSKITGQSSPARNFPETKGHWETVNKIIETFVIFIITGELNKCLLKVLFYRSQHFTYWVLRYSNIRIGQLSFTSRFFGLSQETTFEFRNMSIHNVISPLLPESNTEKN